MSLKWENRKDVLDRSLSITLADDAALFLIIQGEHEDHVN